MNPPQWLWDWLDWYMTTDRDPKKKPSNAPEKIPQWAWDYQAEVDSDRAPVRNDRGRARLARLVRKRQAGRAAGCAGNGAAEVVG